MGITDCCIRISPTITFKFTANLIKKIDFVKEYNCQLLTMSGISFNTNTNTVIFEVKEGGNIASKNYIEINETQKYGFEIKLKIIDFDNPKCYICFYCYDINKKLIHCRDVNYYKNSELNVESFNKTYMYFIVNRNINYKTDDNSYIGIYYNGNIDKLPDDILPRSNFNFDGNKIYLIGISQDIERKISSSTNINIKNHYSGGTYNYPNGNYTCSDGYLKYSFCIEGINNIGMNDPNKFRFGAKYFKFGVITNPKVL